MDNVLLSIIIIGFPAFTGYVIGRARGYYMGMRDAELRRAEAMSVMLTKLREGVEDDE